MSMPVYVSPEQLMKDRADYARKGIARGRSVVVLSYRDGLAFIAENPSSALHKVAEIYDRIGFAAVGKYNEFEILRQAGVRYADLRGYSYDRSDVNARGLANAYAQTLGAVFTTEQKPYEVEIVVGELGAEPGRDQIYRLTYDGSVVDERHFVAMGGQSEQINAALKQRWDAEATLASAVVAGVAALAEGSGNAPAADELEIAVMERSSARRKFRRIGSDQVSRLLDEGGAAQAGPDAGEGSGGEKPAGDSGGGQPGEGDPSGAGSA